MGVEQGHLQPDGKAPTGLKKRAQREESPLHPGGLAPKRMRSRVFGQGGRGKQREVRGIFCRLFTFIVLI